MTTDREEGGLLAYLEELVRRGDRGALAALRRGLGREPGTAPEMHRHVARFIGEKTSWWRQDCLYILAALFAEWYQGRETVAAGAPRDVGVSFRRLVTETNSDSIEKRFEALLACHADDLHVHLRHAVSLLRSKDVPVDWRQLLRDITWWDSPRRWTQRRWAQSFWGGREAAGSEETKEKVAAASE